MFNSLIMVATSENTYYGDANFKTSNLHSVVAKDDGNAQPFAADVNALTQRFGVLTRGMVIEMTLREALDLMSRKRARSDSFRSLQRYLLREKEIVLTIKSNKRENEC